MPEAVEPVIARVLCGVSTAFTVSAAAEQLVTTAIHAGHVLRPALAVLTALDDDERRREEDPYTDQFLGDLGVRINVHQSRFEVDLNRPRDQAVYEHPDDAWGLTVWKHELPAEEVERSRRLHDEFYAELAHHMDRLASRGRFLVLDIHSYNHRREGPDGPAAALADNPAVNVGTGALDRVRWGHVVDSFIGGLRLQSVDGHPLDVRENVRFRGGHFSAWTHDRYPDAAVVLALELKKVFMDEWSGEIDVGHLGELQRAVSAAAPAAVDALRACP